jgi:PAS domain S-box-containing protein
MSVPRELELMLDSIRDYVLMYVDRDGAIKHCNRSVEQNLGYRTDEVVGASFEDLLPSAEPSERTAHRLLERARANGRAEVEGWFALGPNRWLDIVATIIVEGNSHVGYAIVLRDLTSRVEDVRIDAHAVVDSAADFASIASHELRTPLVALQLQLESLLTQGSAGMEPRQIAKLERAVRNVHRLAELIRTLLDVSRIARGELVLRKSRGDLAATVAEAIDRLQESAAAAHCDVTAQLPQEIIGAWDPLRVGQLVSNLLMNAFKYAPNTRVDVTLTREGPDAVLRVEDRGPGIPKGQHERIFGRFERAAPGNLAGMGLGLYVAREIVRAHGGSIVARDRPDGGATLEARLPICDIDPEAKTET